jgi:hypothetical protein
MKAVLFFFEKRFQNAKSGPKFGERGVMLVIPMRGKKGSFCIGVPACVLKDLLE